jgi:cytochrome oxidase Cu insertion factor (SCO1/SenC/PrrC family)
MTRWLTGERPPGDAPAPPGEDHGPAARRAPARHLRLLVVVALAVAAAAGVSAYAAAKHLNSGQAGGPRPSGIPASVSTSLANLMALDSLPGRPAPGFRLTDQTGRAVSLSAFRGKIVVLEFMDPHCTDICPIVSQEFVDAYRDLGPTAGQVVFAAVNVNQYYSSVPAVAKFSAEQRLGTIPSWHFLTGPTPALQTTWRDYNIEVQAPNPNADIVHTSAIYFIDAQGRERYLASPEVDHAGNGTSYLPAGQISGWGQGIAALARALAR